MEIVEKGCKNGQTLLLVCGMMSHYYHGFEPANALLDESYRTLYVKLDGSEGEGRLSTSS